MSDILPALTGPQIDKRLGKRSVAIITDETLVGLKLFKVNGVPNCVHMVHAESHGCANVHLRLPRLHQLALVQELEEGMNCFPITAPMCHRTERGAWETAARIFEALAAAAREQIKTCKP